MDFKKRLIEELNIVGSNEYKDLYKEYFYACEKIAKEYHEEQIKKRKPLLICVNCGDYYGIDINHNCFKCGESII